MQRGPGRGRVDQRSGDLDRDALGAALAPAHLPNRGRRRQGVGLGQGPGQGQVIPPAGMRAAQAYGQGLAGDPGRRIVADHGGEPGAGARPTQDPGFAIRLGRRPDLVEVRAELPLPAGRPQP